MFKFKVKNYSSGNTDRGKMYETQMVTLNPNDAEDRKYYGIKDTDTLQEVKRKYKRFWGGDVAIVRTSKPQPRQNNAFGFSNNRSGSMFSTKGNLPKLFR